MYLGPPVHLVYLEIRLSDSQTSQAVRQSSDRLGRLCRDLDFSHLVFLLGTKIGLDPYGMTFGDIFDASSHQSLPKSLDLPSSSFRCEIIQSFSRLDESSAELEEDSVTLLTIRAELGSNRCMSTWPSVPSGNRVAFTDTTKLISLYVLDD